MKKLSALTPGEKGRLLAFRVPRGAPEILDRYFYRLVEVGFLPGTEFQVPFDAPLSHDPMAVQFKNAVYAIRREDAQFIEVEVL